MAALTIENDLLIGSNVKLMLTAKNKEAFKPGNLDTLIIHYTAGRSAESSAKYLSDENVKASAHLVIGRDGSVYQIVPFNLKAWHAGDSHYGARRYYNQYSIGIELDNAGILTPSGDEFVSWFGKKFPASDAVKGTHRNEQNPRYWHVYTDKQIEVCEQISQLLIQKYGLKVILGHEEIAPGRKQDPGPAFPLDKFRDQLLNGDRSIEAPIENKSVHQVVSDLLNIREGAGTQFKKVALPLTKGTEVTILEEKNGWCKVETKITGWVSKGHLDV